MIQRTLFLLLALIFTSPAVFGQGFDVNNTSFKDLYNKHQIIQVSKTPWAGTYWPFSESGIAWRYRGDWELSPVEKFDKFYGQNGRATAWEKEHHSCKNVPDEYLAGCRAWWGQCNAWAAAAIIEPEPIQSIAYDRVGIDFFVGDQKGLLTEPWMSSSSLFAGGTNKSIETGTWVCDPESPEGSARNRSGKTNYEAFWDLSPRDFFLIMTNYLGEMDHSVVIDRFTGDQVWNQPVAGVRFSDINVSEIEEVEVSGTKVYLVPLEATIYWVNDGVHPDIITPNFDIDIADDLYRSSRAFAEAFARRTLGFTLVLDENVALDRDGKIVSAGDLIGGGFWEAQLDCEGRTAQELDAGHPDFIWQPVAVMPSGGNANPFVDYQLVKEVVAGEAETTTAEDDTRTGDEPSLEPVTYRLTLSTSGFRSLRPQSVKRRVKRTFAQAGIRTLIFYQSVAVDDDKVSVTVSFPNGHGNQDIRTVLANSQLELLEKERLDEEG